MTKHRAPRPRVTARLTGRSAARAQAVHPTDRARRQVAAGLLAVGALAATFLTVAVEPAAPPAPDRSPIGTTSDVAQLSRD
ncbi:hypothetical protein [Streptomyces sp. NPDC046332]|uniref:hypothetical protein n=1 Tax=unclassified Streptomyces TaxID=2593676 RepID=UPI0034087BF5